jgi:hypothetical protein
MKKSQIRSRVRTLLENYMEGEKPEIKEEMMSPEDIAAMTFMDMNDDSVQFETRGRISSIFSINDEKAVLLDPKFASSSPEERRTKIADFINRVNEIIIAKKRFAPGQKRPTKAFSKDDLTRLLALFTDEEGFTSKDIVDAVESYQNVQQANAFLKALEMKGYIKLTNFDDESGKFFDPKKKSALAPEDEFDADLKDLAGLGGDIDLSDPLMEVKQPSKLKEIEAKGRMAALEAKLAAINEMIENITSSLTRLEEDDTMAEMMDKAKMKEMRKEVKLLERMKDKVEKEKAKMEGKYGKKEVVDENIIENDNPELEAFIKEMEKPGEVEKWAKDIIQNSDSGQKAVEIAATLLEKHPGLREHEFWKGTGNMRDIFFDEFFKKFPSDAYAKVPYRFRKLLHQGHKLSGEIDENNLNESKLRMQKLAGLIKG